MKKTLATILVLSLIVALSACDALRATEQKQTSPTTAQTQPTEQGNETLTKEQAIDLALQEAGLPKEAATKVNAELDKDRDETVWEVEFETQEKVYSYDVNAESGIVEEVEIEKEKQPATPQTTPPTEPQATQEQPAQTQSEEKKAISKDRAIEIALNAAGLKKADVTDLEAELDKEREGLYWEVSFETQKTEYDYDIHAYEGTVIKAETEKEDDRPAAQPTQKPTQAATQPAAEAKLTKDQAIEIALNAAGLKKTEVTDLEAELDKERSGLYWEVSFETKQKEYDYDIHAETGKVTKVETEKENEKPVATEPVKTSVTKDQAVETALNAAGLKKADVSELEAELDEERGTPVWEVSFETREKEYSYEINAETGKVVKAESERND